MGLMSWLRGGRSADTPPAQEPGGARPDRGDRVDVSRLEPVQRSVTGQDLLINPRGFEAGLTTRQNGSLGVPLGHFVSPEAPAGLVRGVVDAAPGSPPPPLQRSVGMPMPARRATQPVAAQRAYGDELPSLTSAGPATASAGLPVRRLVGEQPLVPSMGGHSEAATPAPGSDIPGTPPVQRDAVPPPPRRAGGLGAPLPGLPPSAQRRAAEPGEPPSPQVRRAPRTTEAPAAGTPEPAAQGRQDAATEPEAPGRQGVTPEPETVAPLLGDTPLAQRATDGPVPQRATGEASGVPESRPVPGAAVQRATQAPALPTAPLLGDRPLPLRSAPAPGEAPVGGEAIAQRATEGTATDGSGPRPSPFAPVPPSGPPAVAVRWTGPGEGPAPGAAAAPLQRVVSPVQQQAPSVQRQVPPAPDRPGPAPARGPRVPASVRTAGAAAVAAGVAQRMADGSVVFPSAPRDGTSRPVVQRDPEPAEEPPPPPLPDPGPEPGSSATEQPAATATSSTGPDGHPQAPPVTDELVRALYAPLSRLLKADLRLERERSGFLINTRH
ncbi:hypothetical protein SAMN05216483_0377 [Streptomyces sp. 2131.1]|uniref:hypothetical protein n=1 Tax=Streptomyces sp. 2131.1 TaxID=1855346 RepID=UPI00089CABCD|nr:hypothetical protein [Streptomyces sp. 2131.1]SEB76580.1 hypothetical protein SAMN05216483_0377 [Streptomyces sp. 2131.1]